MTQKIYTVSDFKDSEFIASGNYFKTFIHPEYQDKVIKIIKNNHQAESLLPITTELCARKILDILLPDTFPHIDYITKGYRNLVMDRVNMGWLDSSKTGDSSINGKNLNYNETSILTPEQKLILEKAKQEKVKEITLFLRQCGVFIDCIPKIPSHLNENFVNNCNPNNSKNPINIMPYDFFTDKDIWFPEPITSIGYMYSQYRYNMHNFNDFGVYIDLLYEVDFKKLRKKCEKIKDKNDKSRALELIDEYLEDGNPDFVSKYDNYV